MVVIIRYYVIQCTVTKQNRCNFKVNVMCFYDSMLMRSMLALTVMHTIKLLKLGSIFCLYE